MKNITLSIDENLLREARKYAAVHDTTVNAIVREHLTKLVEQQDRSARARTELLRLSDKSKGEMGACWRWNREEAYDRPILLGHERPVLRGDGAGKRAAKKSARK